METATTLETSLGNQLPSGNGTFTVLDSGNLIIRPTSSAISKVNYLIDSQVLVVKYNGSETKYFYRNVPVAVAFHLLIADSFGKFINAHIKPNYEFWTS
jgi:hypothetical protein